MSLLRFLTAPFGLFLMSGLADLTAAPLVYAGSANREFGTMDLASGIFASAGTTTPTTVGLGNTTAGDLYSIDDVSNPHRINRATGVTGLVGALGVCGFTDINRQILAFNTTTGAASIVANYAGQTQGQIWGATADVPEPGSLFQMAAGMVALCKRGEHHDDKRRRVTPSR